MDDVISRKQAVEAMYALVDGCVCDDEWRENPHIDAIVDTLENLPSAHLPDMNVGDTIYRTEAIKVASGYCHPANIADELRKLPPAQPKRGKWIPWKYHDGFRCEYCNEPVDNKHNFCPNCGADMRGE